MLDRKARLAFVLLTIALTAFVLTSGSTTAQSPSAYYFDIRSIYTAEWGVANPVGLAFLKNTNSIAVFSAPKAGQANTSLSLIPFFEGDPVSSAKGVAVADPLNLAFSERTNAFWQFDRSAAALSSFPTSGDGTPNVTGTRRLDARSLGVQNPQGMAFDQKTGQLYVLDAGSQKLFRIAPDAQGNPGIGVAGAVTPIDVRGLRVAALRGIAFNPNNGHLYVMDTNGPRLLELTSTGSLVSTRNLGDLGIGSPQSMLFAPSVDQTDNPSIQNLYVADAGRGNVGGRVIELSLTQTQTVTLAASTATLVQTIKTYQFSPPAPDPAGIVYSPSSGHLIMTDSEVDEMTIFAGKNVFEFTLNGSLTNTYSTMNFSKEPTGIAIHPNGHWFFSKDGGNKITDVNLGADGKFGTSDDSRRTYSISGFGVLDTEDLAIGGGKMYIADGKNAEVWIISPGNNGVFDGPPSAGGDDTATHFDTSKFGIRDPEGIAYDPGSGHLWVVSKKSPLIEVTTSGSLYRSFDISFVNPIEPDGVTVAPGSNTSANHIWVADRMVDNNVNPKENDGRVYEFAVGGSSSTTPTPTRTPTSPAGATNTPTRTPTSVAGATSTPTRTPTPTGGGGGGNLLANPGFELDADNNNSPDSWTSSANFTRSADLVHGGSFAGKHSATGDVSYNSNQNVGGLTAGTTYNFSGWVNIPATSDNFTFTLDVRWRDSAGNALRTDVIKTYTAATGGWNQATASLTAPANTAKATFRMVVSSLNATIYVDDFSFGP